MWLLKRFFIVVCWLKGHQWRGGEVPEGIQTSGDSLHTYRCCMRCDKLESVTYVFNTK